MPRIGAHVSAAGTLDLAFERAENIGASCFQIFISPPQMWIKPAPKEEVVKNFKDKLTKTSLGPNFIHGAYLINLATDSEDNLKKAIDWLTYSLNTASLLGIKGTIFHLGSHKGRGFENCKTQVLKALEQILKNTPSDTELILENCAGAGGGVGRDFDELGELIRESDNLRLKVCLDTQHAFAFGYDIRTKDGIQSLFSEFESEIGIKNLSVVHLNDSKTEFESLKDRHENIGEGFIGKEAFLEIVNFKALEDKPLILEVPGFSDNGPDKENIDLVKSLLKS